MNKYQIICPVVALVLVGILFAVVSGRNHQRYFIQAQSRMIGQDLISSTNSTRLVQIGPGLQKRLAEFLGAPAGIAEVNLGDEPSPIGDGRACSRVVLSNATGERLGIRLRQDAKPERFHVQGFWTITEPLRRANRRQP